MSNSIYQEIIPVLQSKVRGLCVKAYEGHPKGCPNFNKCEDCPPKVGLFENIADLTKPVYIIWNIFNYGEHVSNMKNKHPNWSQRQINCCLYWQGKARKQLKSKILEFKKEHPGYLINTRPEAMGINITETIKQIGLALEWPPITKAIQVALAYLPKDNNI